VKPSSTAFCTSYAATTWFACVVPAALSFPLRIVLCALGSASLRCFSVPAKPPYTPTLVWSWMPSCGVAAL
jgi:hypothetical protein